MWERLKKAIHISPVDAHERARKPSAVEMASYFTVGLLHRLGMESNPYFLENADIYDSFQTKFTAHIIDAVVPPIGMPMASILDGRVYMLDDQILRRLRATYPHSDSENRDDFTVRYDKTIDFEAGLILKTMVVPNLQKARSASLFAEDFLHHITGEPKSSYSFTELPQLQQGVSFRIDQLRGALDKLVEPNERVS